MQFRGCKAWQQAGPLQTRRPKESRPTGCPESSSIRSSSFEALPYFRDEPESDRNPNGLLRQSLLATDRVTFGVLLDQAVLENPRSSDRSVLRGPNKTRRELSTLFFLQRHSPM